MTVILHIKQVRSNILINIVHSEDTNKQKAHISYKISNFLENKNFLHLVSDYNQEYNEV